MARFTNNKKDYINDTVKFSMDNNYGSYNKFLDGTAPIFIVYYKQNIVESTTDIGFGNTYTMIGDNSSITYNKIQHIPLYGVDASVFELNYDEISGVTGSSESQGILLPNTIEPIANDYFTVEYMDNKYLYKVIDINTEDHIKSNNYYRITFKFDGTFNDAILKQVSGKYTCLYDNIGTEDVTIIQDDALELVRKAEEKLDYIKSKYKNSFILDMTNSFILTLDEENRKYLYDPYLIEFIDRNNIFIENRSFKSLVIKNNIDLDSNFEIEYIDSIYYRLENRELQDFSINTMYNLIRSNSNYYGICGDSYYMVKIQELEQRGNNDIIYNKLYGSIVSYDMILAQPLSDNNLIYRVCQIIKEYLNNNISNEEILNRFLSIKDIYMRKNLDNFIYYPMLFFIIKTTIDNIIIKNNSNL